MKNFTVVARLDFLCNKWRASNLGPLTIPKQVDLQHRQGKANGKSVNRISITAHRPRGP